MHGRYASWEINIGEGVVSLPMHTSIEVRMVEWGTRVELKVGGKVASGLTIVDRKMHLGKRAVRIGGIAGVSTVREYRRKGYSRSVMEHALKWMRENGFNMSALFGIPEYYYRYGYHVFMGEHRASVKLRNLHRFVSSSLPGGDIEATIVDSPSVHSTEIAEIYERHNADRPGSIVREPGVWKGFRKGISWEHEPKTLVVERGGEVVGYAAIERWPRPDRLEVADVGATSAEAYQAILRRIYEKASEEKRGEAVFHVPPDCEMVGLLRAVGCTVESDYPWNAGGMARIVDLAGFLGEIREELERRLRGSPVSLGIVMVDDVLGPQEVTVRFDGSGAEVGEGIKAGSVMKASPGTLAQLFLGYLSLRDAVSSVEVRGSVGGFNRLFTPPVLEPYVWQPDRF